MSNVLDLTGLLKEIPLFASKEKIRSPLKRYDLPYKATEPGHPTSDKKVEIVPVSLIYSVKNNLVVCLQGESGTGKSTTLAHLLMNDSQNNPHDLLFIGDDPVILIPADNKILTYQRQLKGKCSLLEQVPSDCGAVISFRGTQEDYDKKVAGMDLREKISHPYLLLKESQFEGYSKAPNWPIYLCCIPVNAVYPFRDKQDIMPIGLVINLHKQDGIQETRKLTREQYLESPFNPSDVTEIKFGSSTWLNHLYESKVPIIDIGRKNSGISETVDLLSRIIKK